MQRWSVRSWESTQRDMHRMRIGLVAAALSGLIGASAEAATACAASLLLVTFLAIIPVGLIWARFEHVSLRKVAVESEHADEELSAADAAK